MQRAFKPALLLFFSLGAVLCAPTNSFGQRIPGLVNNRLRLPPKFIYYHTTDILGRPNVFLRGPNGIRGRLLLEKSRWEKGFRTYWWHGDELLFYSPGTHRFEAIHGKSVFAFPIDKDSIIYLDRKSGEPRLKIVRHGDYWVPWFIKNQDSIWFQLVRDQPKRRSSIVFDGESDAIGRKAIARWLMVNDEVLETAPDFVYQKLIKNMEEADQAGNEANLVRLISLAPTKLPITTDFLGNLLTDPSPRVRAETLKLFARLESTEDEKLKNMLLISLKEDDDARVKATAAALLGDDAFRASDLRCVLLRHLMAAEDEILRDALAESIKRLSGNETISRHIDRFMNGPKANGGEELKQILVEEIRQTINEIEELKRQTKKQQIESLFD